MACSTNHRWPPSGSSSKPHRPVAHVAPKPGSKDQQPLFVWRISPFFILLLLRRDCSLISLCRKPTDLYFRNCELPCQTARGIPGRRLGGLFSPGSGCRRRAPSKSWRRETVPGLPYLDEMLGCLDCCATGFVIPAVRGALFGNPLLRRAKQFPRPHASYQRCISPVAGHLFNR